ncbi:MAG: hypothetical protein AAF413_01200 [Patescibacteria group bacterium]
MTLPKLVATRADVLRLRREVESLDRYFAILHQQGKETENVQLPKISKGLQAFSSENSLNLHDQIVRKTLLEFLDFLKIKSPVIHFSFANDPSAQTVSKLIEWLRREIHPRVLLTVGVSPSIGGGCMLRTHSKVFDFSFKQHFANNKSSLREVISGIVEERATELPETEAETEETAQQEEQPA